MQERALPRIDYWLIATIGGIASILFGIAALAWPGLTLLVFVWLFGIYALIYGLVEVIATFRAARARRTWWTHLLIGLLSIAAGIVALVYPGITTLALLFVIAFWAIIVGTAEVIAGFTRENFLLVIVGAISVVFGFLLLATPVSGALALVLVIGVFAIVRGVLLLISAIRTPGEAVPPHL